MTTGNALDNILHQLTLRLKTSASICNIRLMKAHDQLRWVKEGQGGSRRVKGKRTLYIREV